MHKAINQSDLNTIEKDFLAQIEANLPLLADISRADVLLYVRVGDIFMVVSQSRPHSMAPIYPDNIVGNRYDPSSVKQVDHAFNTGRPATGEMQRWGTRAPMLRQALPVHGPSGKIIGVVSIETNLIEHERQRRRNAHFRRALTALQKYALNGEIADIRTLMPFGEQDGIIYVDAQKRIRYLSGIATNFYRKLGYMERLVGQHIEYLENGDDDLISRVMNERCCFREEVKTQGREWVRQGVPLLGELDFMNSWQRFFGKQESKPIAFGAFILVHDETDLRQRQRELQVKSAIIQETHHRVKNNLQTIAALLRMEARRTTSEEAKRVLEESMNRILSIAVVHEFMANQGEGLINLREVGQRLVAHMRQLISFPGKQLSLVLDTPDIYLPSQQATICALVMNELLQNAIDHGFDNLERGKITLKLSQTTEQVFIEVSDDGLGLRPDFDLHRDGSVGLNIVQVLVRDDLKGELTLKSDQGVTATISFPKIGAEV